MNQSGTKYVKKGKRNWQGKRSEQEMVGDANVLERRAKDTVHQRGVPRDRDDLRNCQEQGWPIFDFMFLCFVPQTFSDNLLSLRGSKGVVKDLG